MAWKRTTKTTAAPTSSPHIKPSASVPPESKHANDVVTLVFTGEYVISGADDGKIKVWTPKLEPVSEIDAHPVNVYSVCVIGDTLYSSSNDGTLKAWNVGTWDLKKHILEEQTSDIIKLCTDDGKLYAGNERGEVLVFENDEQLATYFLGEDIMDFIVIGPLVFNARNVDVSVNEMMPGPRFGYMSRGAMNGRFPIRRIGDKICFLDRTAKNIYIHESTKELKFKRLNELKAHDMTITAIAEMPGRPGIMISGGYDRVLKIWDMKYQKRLAWLDVGVCINEILTGQVGPPAQVYVTSSDGYIARFDITLDN